MLSTNIARRCYRPGFNLTDFNTIQVADMPIHSTGGAGSGGWWLYQNGYVAQNITVDRGRAPTSSTSPPAAPRPSAAGR